MKLFRYLQMDIRTFVLYLFIILTILFDNTAYTVYTTVSFVLLFLCNLSNGNIISNKKLRYNLLFAIWCFISLLWTSNISFGFTRGVTCLILFNVLWTFLSYAKIKHSTFIEPILFVYLIGSLILVVITYQSLHSVNFIELLAAVERLDTDILNLNMLGKYFAIGTVICLHFASTKKRYIYYISFMLFLFFVLLTKSRSALFSVFIGNVFYLYFYFKGIHNMKKYWLTIIVLFTIIYLLSTLNIWGDAFIRIEEMFDFFNSNGKEGDYSTEMRDLYLRKGIESIFESPIIGHGLGSVIDVMRRLVDSSMIQADAYFHNNYVQLWSELGIIGLILFYFPIFRITKKLWNYIEDQNAVALLSILIIFLFCDTNNTTYYHKIYYIFLGISFFYVEAKQKEKSQTTNN